MIEAAIGIGTVVGFLYWRNPRRRQASAIRKLDGFKGAIVFTGGTKGRAIGISADGRRIALTNRWHSPIVLEGNDLLAVEIVRNGDAVTTTDRGSQVAGAVVGGLLLGPVGLLLGGLSGKKTQSNKVASLVLRIATTDMKRPIQDVTFLAAKPPGLDAGSKRLQQAATSIAEWHSRLQASMKMPREDVSQNLEIPALAAPSSSEG